MSEPLVIECWNQLPPAYIAAIRAVWRKEYQTTPWVVRPIVAPRQRTRPPLHVAPRDKSRAYRARRNVRTAQGET